jgi:hypothetical protein
MNSIDCDCYQIPQYLEQTPRVGGWESDFARPVDHAGPLGEGDEGEGTDDAHSPQFAAQHSTQRSLLQVPGAVYHRYFIRFYINISCNCMR